MSNAILLAPGPVQLHPEVQKILAQPMIHHRTPEFDRILNRVLQNLKFIFQTKQPVLMHTSTGSGGMESLLVNLFSKDDEVLAIVSGKFGERWAEMAETFGAKVHRLNIEWGQAATVEQIEKEFTKNPHIKFVLCQATETSTATAHNIEELAKYIKTTPALLLVDGITAVGAYDIKMDEWAIDGLVAGSQKAFMLPAGLSFICLSEKAWKKLESSNTAKFYFDLRREKLANAKGETLFSSNVPLIRALDFVLTRFQEIGLEKHFKQLQRRADFTRDIAHIMGLELYSKKPSNSVTAINVPNQIDGAKLREHLELKYLLTLMGGQDQAKGKILRIGHMGYIPDSDLIETMCRLAKGLNDFSFSVDSEKIKQKSEQWLKDHSV